jgi:hypothetical protein
LLTEILEIWGVGTTVKSTPTLDAELLVTTTFPVVAREGTVAIMVVEFQLVVVALWLLKVTLPDEPKLYPLIVTEAPTGPEVGDRLRIVGRTVNDFELLAATAVWTVTFTEPAVPTTGTSTSIEVEDQDTTDAVTLPNVTLLVPWFIPKLVPDIVTGAPVPPEVTESDVIEGVGKTLGVSESFATYASGATLSDVWKALLGLTGKFVAEVRPDK